MACTLNESGQLHRWNWRRPHHRYHLSKRDSVRGTKPWLASSADTENRLRRAVLRRFGTAVFISPLCPLVDDKVVTVTGRMFWCLLGLPCRPILPAGHQRLSLGRRGGRAGTGPRRCHWDYSHSAIASGLRVARWGVKPNRADRFSARCASCVSPKVILMAVTPLASGW
jgi:hypothetical protein